MTEQQIKTGLVSERFRFAFDEVHESSNYDILGVLPPVRAESEQYAAKRSYRIAQGLKGRKTKPIETLSNHKRQPSLDKPAEQLAFFNGATFSKGLTERILDNTGKSQSPVLEIKSSLAGRFLQSKQNNLQALTERRRTKSEIYRKPSKQMEPITTKQLKSNDSLMNNNYNTQNSSVISQKPVKVLDEIRSNITNQESLNKKAVRNSKNHRINEIDDIIQAKV